MRLPIRPLLGLLFAAATLRAQFQYDASQTFDTTCEPIAARTDADVRGCGFSGPHGGRVNFILVTPRAGKRARPPYAGAIFQHGGGLSMTNFLSEALILARDGVVSMLPDAPARAGDSDTEIVIAERRVLDLLLRQPGIDPRRIAYVGHSYGGVAGGVLAGVEPRIAAFVLIGAVVSEGEADPGRYLPKTHAPVLVECARLDKDENVRGCPAV